MTKFIFATFFFLLLFPGCPDNGVQPKPNPLQLTVEDVTSTEVFLKLSLDQSETQHIVTLKRGDSTIATIIISTSDGDSLFVDEGLLPNKTYTYTLAYQSFTATAQATTMDTTSHNWMWEIDTLGIAYSSLYDVAIIKDTLAYAVGEIYLKDSTGQFDPQPYSVAKWDGKSWTPLKLYYSSNSIISPIRGILVLSTDNIYLAAGSIFHWDGRSQQAELVFSRLSLPDPNATIEKLWGTTNNIYLVGNAGTIAHFSNGVWTKIESGTTLTLNDVWGGSNNWLGNNAVLVAASEKYYAGEKKLLRIKNGSILDSLSWPMQDRRIGSIWFDQHSPVFTAGGGIFQSNPNGAWKEMSFPLIYTNRIRGNASNDLIVVGDFGIVGHFNGVGWRTYDDLKLSNGNYESMAIKNNLVIAVGWYGSNGKAVVAIGKR